MNYTKLQWWERFQKYYTEFPELGLAIDLTVDDAVFEAMVPRIQKVFTDLDALEKGAIANPDENRMVGHYWLRNPELAPTPEIRVDGRTKERSAVGSFQPPYRELALMDCWLVVRSLILQHVEKPLKLIPLPSLHPLGSHKITVKESKIWLFYPTNAV
ncbi:MAG TPA: hypothetical protein VK731_03560 [Candidatus Cybelea sp.]|nr:hypothetical protein [Candidatus Cybelea sp.]